MKKTMTAEEVAENLGVHPTTVARWIRQGLFPGAFKVGPGPNSPYRIPVESYEAYIAKRQAEAEEGNAVPARLVPA